jgi:hypothetical protein
MAKEILEKICGSAERRSEFEDLLLLPTIDLTCPSSSLAPCHQHRIKKFLPKLS